MYGACKRVFSMLPLAALVQGKTLILHGGGWARWSSVGGGGWAGLVQEVDMRTGHVQQLDMRWSCTKGGWARWSCRACWPSVACRQRQAPWISSGIQYSRGSLDFQRHPIQPPLLGQGAAWPPAVPCLSAQLKEGFASQRS